MRIKAGDIVKYKPEPEKYGTLKVQRIRYKQAVCTYYQFGSNGRAKQDGLLQLEVTLQVESLSLLVKKKT